MKNPKESTFDLSHDVKMSGKMGLLLPCLVMDILPGDRVKLGADALIRLAPILAPIMHRVDFTIHYWFVPNRILWENWEKFISGTKLDGQEDFIIPPYLDVDDTSNPDFLKLADYMGLPTPPTGATSEQVSALPFSAYNLIYNENYRDQNLITEVPYELNDANNTSLIGDFKLRNRAYEHDYFTSCLPFAQKGSAVDLPLGNVVLKEDWSADPIDPWFEPDPPSSIPLGAVNQVAGGLDVGGATNPVAYNPNGSLVVGATTINDLRRAYRLQEWLEKNARGGTRYTEQILVHFNVKSPDARLQRPEYITGLKAPVIISEVLNTSGPTAYFDSETSTPVQVGAAQGDMAGHGMGAHHGRVGQYYAYEHGWIIGLISIMPKTAYQQGIPKMFTRNDYLDYAFPTFANLGEQEVLTREVYAFGASSNTLFGYIPRYAEYKFMNSRVAGDFRTTLDYWHLGRIFGSTPALNKAFIECIPEDVERIFAVQDETDNIWMHILHKINTRRKLPFFGTPTI
ncbi:MAG: major capsid protein [Arizlama microvirus]|nr:MAG: major capsid protein [Arizlama microvirus]